MNDNKVTVPEALAVSTMSAFSTGMVNLIGVYEIEHGSEATREFLRQLKNRMDVFFEYLLTDMNEDELMNHIKKGEL